ncbi:MAG: LEA type 2 family protein [Balneolaceae bacterium]|nr:LEA type 2 family protein [Balneolaceae bacterium]
MKKIILSVFILFLLSGCNTLRDLSNVQKPSVRYSSMSIDDISFSDVTLLFDFEVNNPNNFGVSADQYRYEFFINGKEFVTGIQTENLRIAGASKSIIQVPVSLTFSEVFDTIDSAVRQDSIAYRISSEVQFDLAGVSKQRVPVSAEGQLPIPKLPKIELSNFNINELSFSGAEMAASFRVQNPNSFGISFADASYNLTVNENEWLNTTLERDIELGESESELITIPIRLNSSQMGSVLFDMLRGEKEFPYTLTGSARVSADIPGFDGFEVLPFNISGIYRLD